jgi:sortase A
VHAAQVEAAPRRDVLGTFSRGLGQLLLTVGFVFVLFVVYEVYVTDLLSGREQAALSDQLRTEWEQQDTAGAAGVPVAAPAVGNGVAFIRIPRLGDDYRRAVVEGTGQDELAQGPGHYVGTALPGQPGNVGIAGHRVGKGSPFLDLDRLRPGDPIVIETRDDWFVYRVLGDPATGDFHTDPSGVPGREIVDPSDVAVIAATPDAAGSEPTGSYLTLTTCNPKYSDRERLVIHAVQDGGAVSKADAPAGPPALRGS